MIVQDIAESVASYFDFLVDVGLVATLRRIFDRGIGRPLLLVEGDELPFPLIEKGS